MKRLYILAVVLTIGAVPLLCATLERLTLDEMIAQSTAIVRGKVTGSYAALSGPVIYTHYSVQVSELLKGSGSSSTVDVACPGGAANGLQQTFSGAPELQADQEYVLFLWTGKSGLTQLIGYSQGVFSVSGSGTGAVAVRAAARETMVARGTGLPVKDESLAMNLNELRARIASVLGGAAK